MTLNVFVLMASALLSCKAAPSSVKSASDTLKQQEKRVDQHEAILPAAYQTQEYLPILKGKKVGLVVNLTSMVGNTHLVDTLLKSGIEVKKILAPEHGFRGDAANGETVSNTVDSKTGLPLISIYGKSKKPSPEMLKDLDILVFDIQDVGARFFTYISTMHYVMEACAENGKPLLILDRPNPHGHYVAGPILQPEFKSFIGMHPIPIVHGLTVGELAQMINGEKWLDKGVQCKLTVIKNKNYLHDSRYVLPIRPSPNLPNDQSIRLYPSICLFEGTPLSLGRGTQFPFQVVGLPDPEFGTFTFTPKSIPGMALNPPQENKLCYGWDMRNISTDYTFTLKYIIDAYAKVKNKEAFFTPFFDKLSGNKMLKEQIRKGMSEKEIFESWKKELDQYKEMRMKYLLYP